MKHVALIRGINVGRAKRVAMADLRTLLEDFGYSDVRTLLNSGNAVFTSPTKTVSASKIEEGLAKKLKVEARVMVLPAKDLAAVVSENSLSSVATDASRLFVGLLFDPKDRDRLLPLAKQEWGREQLAVGARAAYIWCPEGLLASKLSEAVGKVLRDGVTTRNWATIMKLHELASN